jgi:hypothetical protein
MAMLGPRYEAGDPIMYDISPFPEGAGIQESRTGAWQMGTPGIINVTLSSVNGHGFVMFEVNYDITEFEGSISDFCFNTLIVCLHFSCRPRRGAAERHQNDAERHHPPACFLPGQQQLGAAMEAGRLDRRPSLEHFCVAGLRSVI